MILFAFIHIAVMDFRSLRAIPMIRFFDKKKVISMRKIINYIVLSVGIFILGVVAIGVVVNNFSEPSIISAIIPSLLGMTLFISGYVVVNLDSIHRRKQE